MKTLISIMLFTALTLCAADTRLGKKTRSKIIAVGTAGPTIDYLIKNYRTVEKMLPADGAVIFLDVPGVRDGKPETAHRHNLFADWKWEKKWFEPSLEAIRKIKFEKLTDNFIYVAVTGAHYDMFDDEAWKKVCNNIGLMAWYAREAGFKGIFFDVEHYTKGYRALFQHDLNGKHSFSETWTKAQQRGREFMQAMTAEYPAITIMTTYGLAINFEALANSDPIQSLSMSSYGLLPAFYNGMYEVMPEKVLLTDGSEVAGYAASGETAFAKIYLDFYRKSPQLLTSANRDKFFTHSVLSPGLFLDAYIYDKGIHIIKSPDMDRLALLRTNLMLAMRYSDNYIWLYSEQCRWFPAKMADAWEKVVLTMPGKGRLWEEALPGITASIEFIRDPEAYVAHELAAGKLTKVLNADFQADGQGSAAPGHPACQGISFWQTSSYKTHGTFEVDKTVGCQNKPSLKLTDIKWGSACCHVPVKPGEVYFIRAAAKAEGAAKPNLTVAWQDTKWKWVNQDNNKCAAFVKPLSNGWNAGSLAVTVPPGASYMSVQLGNGAWGLTYEPDVKNVCWFDDLEIYKVF